MGRGAFAKYFGRRTVTADVNQAVCFTSTHCRWRNGLIAWTWRRRTWPSQRTGRMPRGSRRLVARGTKSARRLEKSSANAEGGQLLAAILANLDVSAGGATGRCAVQETECQQATTGREHEGGQLLASILPKLAALRAATSPPRRRFQRGAAPNCREGNTNASVCGSEAPTRAGPAWPRCRRRASSRRATRKLALA